MTDDERWFSAQTIILKIHAITGWTIPISEMMNILVDQFQQKLLETYANVTTKEIEYAFRNKGLDIKDWGKAMNLALIDEVMLPYLHNRYDLGLQEQKLSSQVSMVEEKKELSDKEWQEWLEDIAKYELNKIPCDSYNYLERTQKLVLTKDEKHEYMQRAIAHISGILDPVSIDGIDFAAMKKKGMFDKDATGTLITIAKRLAVYDYLNKKSPQPE